MANHCTEAICSECGASRCLLGCGDVHPPSDLLRDAFAWLQAEGYVFHHYQYNICHCCKRKTMYEYPVMMDKAVNELKSQKHSPFQV